MDVGIIGAGIVGLAHAWSAAERGHCVTVFERSSQASGASIRNFGMIWPIGQPAGHCHATALRSRDRWLEVSAKAGIWMNRCGSLHLAHHDDEWDVLQEFHSRAPQLGYECALLSSAEVQSRTPAANPVGLRGGLFSPTEIGVNPAVAVREIARWLAAAFGIRFEFNTAVTHVDAGRTVTGDGRRWRFDRTIVCGGADVVTLFPNVLATSGMRRCKLQMLKTVSQPDGWRIGPHLASGLTLRHYRNFEICSTLAKLKQRIFAETPELDLYGIHVMASQDDAGRLILGDSHEYDEIDPFNKACIDELILRELQTIFSLPDWTIEERWHGVYVKLPTEPVSACEPLPNVFIRTGTGGAGMTMAFGLAERDWEQWS